MNHNCMKIVLSIAFVFVFQVSGILAQAGSEKFWDSLKTNCGKAFASEIIHAPENDSFRGKKLVMHVRSCEKNEIKIPFFVGEDRSRTWILTKIGDRIRLKHDHRHKDGTPDKITMYGGTPSNGGSATRQVFPADEETRRMLPAAASNVWWIDLAKESFTYNLRRVGTDRYFSIKFDLTKTVDAPPAPWGWDKNVPRRITYDEKQDRYPSFSPDGKKILFESNRRNFWGIYTMETDGTNISEVSRVRAEMRFPSWNQDGTRIIYSGKQGVNFSVYHMRADGTDIRRFMKGFMGIFATWSPDGKSIAFTSLFGGKPDVYLLDTENSVRAPLVATRFRDVWLRWSPDGKKVAFFRVAILTTKTMKFM